MDKQEKRILELEKILLRYLETATAPARGKNKYDLTYCDDMARGYFAKYGGYERLWPKT